MPPASIERGESSAAILPEDDMKTIFSAGFGGRERFGESSIQAFLQ